MSFPSTQKENIRRLTRKIARILPLDVIPIKANADNVFVNEIEAGEIIYER